ncbi:MAG: pyridoxal phosphate-dependent aminotransferase [Rhodospirillales bacterium]|nr:pyridoxal phosphate-dependent aminotransferase [Rhodospirillales bacterium]
MTGPGLADRLDGVEESAATAMAETARRLRAQGVKVISLAIGEPDFPTPPHVIAAATRAAEAGDTKYPPVAGTAALKAAVQRKFRRDNGLDYTLDEILITNGAKQAIFAGFMATCNPGDEVIIPTPAWISYRDMAKFAGATPVFVPCPQDHGFRPQAEALAAAITPRTKWLLLNFPGNPTGTVCSRADMKALTDLMMQHPHVWIMTDDIYEHLLYDEFAFCTVAQVEPRLRERTLTVNGVSKAYAMTGWRVGFCGGPRRLIKAMENVQGQSTNGISTIGQAAAVAALDGPQDLLRERAASYRARRDLVVSLLNAAPGLACHKPEGAFYVFASVAGCLGKTSAGGHRIETDADFAAALLAEQHVATVQGAAYGASPHVRVSYATDEASLREACARIRAFCEGLTPAR